jgi:hypothetical protein
MATAEEYEAKIKTHGWDELRALWTAVKNRDTPGWDAGKALEYLIIRAFELDGAKVKWPYSVFLFGEEVEQIDGSVNVGGLYCLVESKDETENIAVGPITKLRNQLLRRPAGTVGLLFASKGFTDPAVQLAHFTLPQAILLWSRGEIDHCMAQKKIAHFCEMKYRACVDLGAPDFDIRIGKIP